MITHLACAARRCGANRGHKSAFHTVAMTEHKHSNANVLYRTYSTYGTYHAMIFR